MGAAHRPLNATLFKAPFPVPTPSGGRGGGLLDWSDDARVNVDVYHCPRDLGFPGMHEQGWRDSGLSSYNYYGTSYAVSPLFVGPGPGSLLMSNSVYARPVSTVPQPTTTVMYWENAARYAIYANNTEDYDQTGCSWPYPIAK